MKARLAGSSIVELARSGRQFEVKEGASILSTLRDAGVDVSYSCAEGVCGACEVKFLAGTPVHRDFVRSAEEHDRACSVIICQAACRSERLVLDL
jgi:vanillate O-demethylase ferredoxin subunit